MSVFEALVLGFVQGITEFLPVSSSGHLVLLQKIFGISEPALAFDTALHGGTLAAVIIVLRKEIWNILRRIFQPLTLYIIIATIPAVAAALLFKDTIEAAFASASLLGFCFLVTSALLFAAEKISRVDAPAPGRMNAKNALVIGLFQAVALIPGISRSGATISGALFRRLDRNFAATFSFLLSIPAILGALLLQIKALAGGEAGSTGLVPLAAGTLCAFLVAIFSIKLALKIVREHSLAGFSVYTGVLGFLIILDKFFTHFFF